MRYVRALTLLLLTAVLTEPLRGADGWLNLKLGMSGSEVEAALGTPLVRSEGRGFEVWTYDDASEVVFYGRMIAWTSPASSAAPKYVMADWQFTQGLAERLVLPKPPRRRNVAPPAPTPEVSGPASYGFRFRPR
jgi:hypothetical protein